MSDLFALLIHELGFRPHEIGKLTRYQVRELLLRGRDENGKLELRGSGSRKGPYVPVPPEEQIRRHCRLQGWPEWRIEERVAEYQEQVRTGQIEA